MNDSLSVRSELKSKQIYVRLDVTTKLRQLTMCSCGRKKIGLYNSSGVLMITKY